MKKLNYNQAIIKIYRVLPTGRKYELLKLGVMTIIVSILEVISIGSVVPFIGLISGNVQASTLSALNKIYSYFPLLTDLNVKTLVTCIFMLAIIISGASRTFLLHYTTKISFMAGADIGFKLFKNFLTKGYLKNLNDDSGDIVNTVIKKTDIAIKSAILPILTLASSSIIVVSILLLMIYINLFLTCVLFSVLLLAYASVGMKNKKRILENSRIISENSQGVINIIKNGYYGIREIILNNDYKYHLERYFSTDSKLRKADAENYYLSLSPRYIIETIGVIVIVASAYFSETEGAIALIGVFAMSAQRLIPYVQHVYTSIIKLLNSKYSLIDVARVISEGGGVIYESNEAYIDFDYIELKNVNFAYPNTNVNIIENFSYKFKRNSIVGIIGRSGVGKSTMIDLIAGLYAPTNGKILVDGVDIHLNLVKWYNSISYLSQKFYLLDDTIRNNIVLERNDYDMKRLIESTKIAEIYNDIIQFEGGFDFRIGENGVRLSGGQRQRIGIARAIYNKSTILILDEFTSALDSTTENVLIENMLKKIDNITVFIVGHRSATLDICNILVDLTKGVVIERKKF